MIRIEAGKVKIKDHRYIGSYDKILLKRVYRSQ